MVGPLVGLEAGILLLRPPIGALAGVVVGVLLGIVVVVGVVLGTGLAVVVLSAAGTGRWF